MELLPIIYTTLLIFTGVAVVTIIGSYISYNIRRRKGLLYDDDVTEILETPDIVKERSQKNNNNKSDHKKESSSKNRSRNDEKSSARSDPNSTKRERERKRISSRDREKEHQRYIEEKRIAEEIKRREEKEKRITKDRIQVLNTLDSSKAKQVTKPTSEFSKTTENQKKYNTLGDDIMKNYAENKDDSFQPLQTKNKKK